MFSDVTYLPTYILYKGQRLVTICLGNDDLYVTDSICNTRYDGLLYGNYKKAVMSILEHLPAAGDPVRTPGAISTCRYQLGIVHLG